jgi:hypothetical protein
MRERRERSALLSGYACGSQPEVRLRGAARGAEVNPMGGEDLKRQRCWPRAAALAVLLLMASLAASHDDAAAQSAGLEGSWSGGGSVAFASGQRERAQCRAQYRRASGNAYTLTATCATPSGRATQTATLRQVGGNTYQGQFHNTEYDVSGTIVVTVSGNRQSVRLTGDAGSGAFELRR